MTRPVILLLLAVTTAIAATATSFDNITRLRLASRDNATPLGRTAPSRVASTDELIPVIIEFDTPSALDSLRNLGGVIFHTRENLALGSLPAALVDDTLLDGVRRVCAARTVTPSLDRAREMTGVDLLHNGSATAGIPYTGRDVVVGICDIGFDPSHPTFIDPATGASRISRIVSYRETRGERTVLHPEDYASWVTDTTAFYHATHVAGILGGSCREHSFHGVATEADMVITVSELSDVGILSGAEDIIAYARETGRPAVINMSVGNYLGPHDGSTLFNRYIALLGREAVICLASGNEATERSSCVYRFTDSRKRMVLPLIGNDWVHFDLNGYIDIWSEDSRPVKVTPGVYISNGRKEGYQSVALDLTQEITGVTTDPEIARKLPTVKYDPELKQYYEGTILATASVSPLNGRYNVTLMVSTHCSEESPEGPWANFHPTLIVEGESGQRVDLFADSQGLSFSYIPGEVIPTPDMSVSDLACGDKIVCVGMWTSRSEVTTLEGETTVYPGFYDRTVNPASSYGTTISGSVLPHVVAPGAMVISAISNPYLEAHPDRLSRMVARTTVDGRDWYWYNECGTSMATPFTVGTIALWMQAEPSLNVDNVYDILSHTNITDVTNPADPRHGRGWLDPVEGLKYVLSNYAQGGITVENRPAPIAVKGTVLTLLDSTAGTARVAVHGVDGRVTAEASLTDSLDIASLVNPGIYIVSVTLPGRPVFSTKVAVTRR